MRRVLLRLAGILLLMAIPTRAVFDHVRTYFGEQTRAEVAAGLAYHSYNHYG